MTAGSRAPLGISCSLPPLSPTSSSGCRGAQVIYPKDLGAILMAADIFPGLGFSKPGSARARLDGDAARG